MLGSGVGRAAGWWSKRLRLRRLLLDSGLRLPCMEVIIRVGLGFKK